MFSSNRFLLSTTIFLVISALSFSTHLSAEGTLSSEDEDSHFIKVSNNDRQLEFSKLQVIAETSNENELKIKSLDEKVFKLTEMSSYHSVNRDREFSNLNNRISDLSFYMNSTGFFLGILGLIVTIAAIFLGWSAKERAIAEAKSEANKYFDEEGKRFIEEEKSRFEEARNKLTSKIENDFRELNSKLSSQSNQLIAMRQFEDATEYSKQKSINTEISTYDDLVSKFKHFSEPEIQDYVAMALIRKGLIFITNPQYKNLEKAIEAFSEVLTLFSRSSNTRIMKQVAYATIFQIQAMSEKNTIENIDVSEDLSKMLVGPIDKVFHDYHQSVDPEEQELLARTLSAKIKVLSRTNNLKEEAKETADKLIELYSESTNPECQFLVADALFYRSMILNPDSHKERIELYEEIEKILEPLIPKIYFLPFQQVPELFQPKLSLINHVRKEKEKITQQK
ncbi:hypothetical protein ACWU4D_12440 [Vibrio sp. WJH972]